MTIFVFICKTDLFKPVKQANGTAILPPSVFTPWRNGQLPKGQLAENVDGA
jgi:hypothetical protein